MPAELSSVPSPDPLAVIEEFKRLYHAARREHNRAGKNATADSPAHQAAFQHARQHQIPEAERLLEALLSVWTESSGALETLDAAWVTLPETLKGQGEHLRGMLLSKLGRHAEAIECYQQALTTPDHDMPGNALGHMGNFYAGKNEHDRAIECYQKALAAPSFDEPGTALHNIGSAYYAKGEIDLAISYFKQAIAAPEYDTPGYSHSNMGKCYAQKGEHERAIGCYRQALTTPLYDKSQLTRLECADSLRELGRLKDASSLVNEVLAEPNTENRHYRARYLKNLIEEAQAGLMPSATEEALAKSVVQKAGGEADSPEARIVEKLQGSNTQQRDKHDQYLRRGGCNRDNVFSCLRGWSSSVTLL